jgi:hypothetical protein
MVKTQQKSTTRIGKCSFGGAYPRKLASAGAGTDEMARNTIFPLDENKE